jgi:hypothetical protein
MKYLLLCNRHNSIYGDNWCLWWGNRESRSGYSSDIRIAHRFTEEEIKKYENNEDIKVSIDVLGISEEYEPIETYNRNLCVLMEKGNLNRLMNLELKPLFQEETRYCPKCGNYDLTETTDNFETVYICKECNCEFDEYGTEM